MVAAVNKQAVERSAYWNDVYGTVAAVPLPSSIGMVLAGGLPYWFFQQCKSGGLCSAAVAAAADGSPGLSAADSVARLVLLAKLQIAVAFVLIANFMLSGVLRASSSPAAAHDPAAAAHANLKTIAWTAGERVVHNTTEQFLIMLSVALPLLFRVPEELLCIFPAWYATWTVGRLIYAAGYVHNGVNRMMGFPATFLPTLAAFGYTVFLVYQQGF